MHSLGFFSQISIVVEEGGLSVWCVQTDALQFWRLAFGGIVPIIDDGLFLEAEFSFRTV